MYHPWHKRNIARCMPPCSRLAPAHTHPCADAGASRQRRWLQNVLAITHSWRLGWTNGNSNFSVQNSLQNRFQLLAVDWCKHNPKNMIDMDLRFLGFLSLGLCLGIGWRRTFAFGWLSQVTQCICGIIQIGHCLGHIIFIGLQWQGYGRDMPIFFGWETIFRFMAVRLL